MNPIRSNDDLNGESSPNPETASRSNLGGDPPNDRPPSLNREAPVVPSAPRNLGPPDEVGIESAPTEAARHAEALAWSEHAEALAWSEHADALTAWAMERLVVRSDVWGAYLPPEARSPRWNVVTAKVRDFPDSAGAMERAIRDHFRATVLGDHGRIVGLHTTAIDEKGQCRSKWGAIDVDHHAEGLPPDANLKAALAWHDRTAEVGLQPILEDSNGRGGFHLWVLFTDHVPTETVRRLLLWMCRDFSEYGIVDKERKGGTSGSFALGIAIARVFG